MTPSLQSKPFAAKLLLDATLMYVPLGHCIAISVGTIVITWGVKTTYAALYKYNPTE